MNILDIYQVYQAMVKIMDTQTVKTNTGPTGGAFRNRYKKHISDFRNEGGESANCDQTYLETEETKF